MNTERATLVLHPNHIGAQIKNSSNDEIIADTASEDYNANRHTAEKWLKENGYVHSGGSEYEKVPS